MNRYMEFADSGGQPESLVMAIDVSPSMEDTDWKPSRLAGAMEASDALLDVKVEQHPHDQVGIVAFSGSAQVVRPLMDISTGVILLKRAVAGLKTRSATNITAGLECGSSLFNRRDHGMSTRGLIRLISGFLYEEQASPPSLAHTGTDRLILLTDGEHNTGRRPDGRGGIAELLKNRGVCIDVIGIGGGPKEVNEPMLKRIASKNPDGSPRYCFIGDKGELIRKFERLAAHIKRG